MPDRIIRERALLSRTLNDLSDLAERTFWRLTVVADDYGCFDADPRVVAARCYPLKLGRLTSGRMQRVREELVTTGLVRLYTVERREYGIFVNWDRYQRRDKRGKPKFPLPPGYAPVIPGDSRESQEFPSESRDAYSYSRGGAAPGVPEAVPPPIAGGSDGSDRSVRPVPKPVSRRPRIRYGRGSLPIRAPIRPIVDAWVAGFTARFRVAPGDPKPWDLDAAEDLLARHGLPLVLEILDGAFRVGTHRMRTRERWSLQAIADEWETLVAMRAKGELA